MKGRNETDLCIACQCGPVLAGVKTSNIFMAKGIGENQLMEIFSDTPLACRKIYQDMYLVYWPERIQREIMDKRIQHFLRKYGYRVFWTNGVLDRLCKRMERYKKGLDVFPHELGIFLGYPLEDVQGFIDNRGKNYLYCGYWKVYGDVKEAKRLFARYRMAKAAVFAAVRRGWSVKALAQDGWMESYGRLGVGNFR
ncbi:MAG: DUF3793 family protein [Ruminococcus sp.]|jgi:hypothetical protein